MSFYRKVEQMQRRKKKQNAVIEKAKRREEKEKRREKGEKVNVFDIYINFIKCLRKRKFSLKRNLNKFKCSKR